MAYWSPACSACGHVASELCFGGSERGPAFASADPAVSLTCSECGGRLFVTDRAIWLPTP